MNHLRDRGEYLLELFGRTAGNRQMDTDEKRDALDGVAKNIDQVASQCVENGAERDARQLLVKAAHEASRGGFGFIAEGLSVKAANLKPR